MVPTPPVSSCVTRATRDAIRLEASLGYSDRDGAIRFSRRLVLLKKWESSFDPFVEDLDSIFGSGARTPIEKRFGAGNIGNEYRLVSNATVTNRVNHRTA